MFYENGNRTVAFWQEPEDMGEQAIILSRYRGIVELKQAKNEIRISEDCIDEFIKALRHCAKILIE